MRLILENFVEKTASLPCCAMLLSMHTPMSTTADHWTNCLSFKLMSNHYAPIAA